MGELEKIFQTLLELKQDIKDIKEMLTTITKVLEEIKNNTRWTR